MERCKTDTSTLLLLRIVPKLMTSRKAAEAVSELMTFTAFFTMIFYCKSNICSRN